MNIANKSFAKIFFSNCRLLTFSQKHKLYDCYIKKKTPKTQYPLNLNTIDVIKTKKLEKWLSFIMCLTFQPNDWYHSTTNHLYTLACGQTEMVGEPSQ